MLDLYVPGYILFDKLLISDFLLQALSDITAISLMNRRFVNHCKVD